MIENMRCFATKNLVDGKRKVSFMYREQQCGDDDSGWRFFSECDSQAIVDNPANLAIYAVSTIVAIDPDIKKFLNRAPDISYERTEKDGKLARSKGFNFSNFGRGRR
jgi:hypothetical protein